MELCREYGTPPYNVIVLHGGPGAPGCAAGLCRILGEETGVLEHLQKSRTIDGLMDEILYLIKKYTLSQIILVGHSFGAWLALLFAEKYPLLVSRTLIIGCGPLKSTYLPEIIRTRNERAKQGLSDTDNYQSLPESSMDMLYFDEEQHKALMAEIFSLRESGELLDRILHVTCPVTAFHGKYDPHPIRGLREPLEGKLPNFRLIILEKCGHNPWKEKYAREEFLKLIRNELVIN